MPQSWGPTTLGKLVTSTKPWSLALDQEQFAQKADGHRHSGSFLLLYRLVVSPGAFLSAVRVEGSNGQAIHLDGIPEEDAKQLHVAVAASIAVIRRQQHIAELVRQLVPEVEKVKAWVSRAKDTFGLQLRRRGWLSHQY